MASQSSIKYHIERAAETIEIMDKRLLIETDHGTYEPGSAAWYAYLSGRMSAQLESMAEILASDLLGEED